MKIGLITDCHAALKPAEDNKYYAHSFVKFQDSCAYFLRDHVDFVVNLGDVYQSVGESGKVGKRRFYDGLSAHDDACAVFARFRE